VRIAVVIALITVGAALAQEGIPQPAGNARPDAPSAGAARGVPAIPAPADEATYRQQVGYYIGRQFGEELRQGQVVVDQQALLAGVADGMTDARPRWSEAQLMVAMQRFQQEMAQKQAAQMQQMQQLAAQNKQEGDRFLSENRQREGVQTTASGLQYRVLKQGNGPSPTRADRVRVHYRGTLLNGQEFDSSLRRGEPAEFGVSEVIPGWTEALQKMRVGDKWQLFVPAGLAYGDEQRGRDITPGSTLVFEVELLEILK
jgi:FKBP-type peptidyl-prolyl cis-trans isomerase